MNQQIQISTGSCLLLVGALLCGACADGSDEALHLASGERVEATVGAGEAFEVEVDGMGAVLEGAPGTPFAGVRVEVPPGALAAPTRISVREGEEATPLPAGGFSVGFRFEVVCEGQLLAPLRLTLPYRAAVLREHGADAFGVVVWFHDEDQGWEEAPALYRTEDTIAIHVERGAVFVPGLVAR